MDLFSMTEEEAPIVSFQTLDEKGKLSTITTAEERKSLVDSSYDKNPYALIQKQQGLTAYCRFNWIGLLFGKKQGFLRSC